MTDKRPARPSAPVTPTGTNTQSSTANTTTSSYSGSDPVDVDIKGLTGVDVPVQSPETQQRINKQVGMTQWCQEHKAVVFLILIGIGILCVVFWPSKKKQQPNAKTGFTGGYYQPKRIYKPYSYGPTEGCQPGIF